MKELLEMKRMSHSSPVTMMFFLYKFNFKDRIFHSEVICGPESCKRDGMIKTRPAANLDGCPLRSVLLFE